MDEGVDGCESTSRARGPASYLNPRTDPKRHFAAILRIELAGTAIGTTVVAPGPVDTSLWDRVEASDYTSGVLRRFAQARLLTKDDPATIAELVGEAVQRNRRHVRTPRRAVALNLLSEAPRRMTEVLLKGAEPEPTDG